MDFFAGLDVSVKETSVCIVDETGVREVKVASERVFRVKFSVAALALTAAFGSAFATAAEAQNFPSKPIRAIVSSSAGGTSDIFMRVLAEELHKRIGQPVIVENRPGGAFNIGARACAEAAPDGYTVCMMSAEPVAFDQFLFKTLPFDPAAFVPIPQFFFLTQMLVVARSSTSRRSPN